MFSKVFSRIAENLGQATWLGAYNAGVQRGLPKERALFEAVNTLRYQEPFNALSESDVAQFAAMFASCSQPEFFTQVLMEFQKSGDTAVIRDTTQLRRFVAHLDTKFGTQEIAPAATEPASPDQQLLHQQWDDRARLSLGIDVPPFVYPRPRELFIEIIKGTGLTPDDFEVRGPPIFGALEFLVKANIASIERFRAAESVLHQRCDTLLSQGRIRGWI